MKGAERVRVVLSCHTLFCHFSPQDAQVKLKFAGFRRPLFPIDHLFRTRGRYHATKNSNFPLNKSPYKKKFNERHNMVWELSYLGGCLIKVAKIRVY